MREPQSPEFFASGLLLNSRKSPLPQEQVSVRTLTLLGSIRDQMTTKAELHAMEASITKWIVGTMLASAALAATIAKLIS